MRLLSKNRLVQPNPLNLGDRTLELVHRDYSLSADNVKFFSWFFQIPSDFVVKCQALDISDVILVLIWQRVVYPDLTDNSRAGSDIHVILAIPISVAYLLAADNVSGPLPISLREVNQPVSITRNRFSRPRAHLLAYI